MKRAQFTNTGAGLVTIGFVNLVPGDTNPKNTTIPSEQTIATWTRDLTPQITADIVAELEATKVPKSEHAARIKAALPKKLEAALDEKAEQLLEGVRKAPIVRAGIVKEGVAMMPPAKPDPASGAVTASLVGLENPKALALIKMCQDMRTIDAWAATETQSQNPRPEIKDALLARAEALAKG